jgi:hypothetical protein
MNRLKVIMLSAVISTFYSQLAWAGSIDAINLSEEQARTVGISTSLCPNGSIESTDAVLFDDTLYLHMFMAEECIDGEEAAPAGEQIFTVSACDGYSSIVAFMVDSETDMVHAALSADDRSMEVNADDCVAEQEDACLVANASCIPGTSCVEGICPDLLTCFSYLGDSVAFETCMSCETVTTCEEDNSCELELANCLSAVEVPVIIAEPVEEEVPSITINCNPDTLNMQSDGRWVTCYLEISEGNPEDIDVDSITLTYMENQGLTVEKSDIEDETLMVKFSRQDLIGLVAPEDVPADMELIVAGNFFDGVSFSEIDIIQVINPEKKKTRKTRKTRKTKKK